MKIQALLSLLPHFLFYTSIQAFALPREPRQQKTYNFLDRDVDAYVEKVLADWQSPGGIAVAFVRKDEQGNWVDIETKGYGIATATGKRVTEDTTFNIGSNSKVYST
jgi:CubicO group peptidase (beta-lactamase class C family)